MTDAAIYGAGGLGRLVLDVLLQTGRVRPVAYLDSDPTKHGSTVDGLPVVGGLDHAPTLIASGVRHVLVAVGDNHARVRLARELTQHGAELISAIHPLASIAPSAQLGEHVVVGARTTICVHADIGAHSIIAAGSIVEHDNVIGLAAFLEPAVRLAGGVHVEDFVTLGVGACVIPGRRVGREARVRPGAVVIHDVLPHSTVGGVPARCELGPRSGFVPDSPSA